MEGVFVQPACRRAVDQPPLSQAGGRVAANHWFCTIGQASNRHFQFYRADIFVLEVVDVAADFCSEWIEIDQIEDLADRDIKWFLTLAYKHASVAATRNGDIIDMQVGISIISSCTAESFIANVVDWLVEHRCATRYIRQCTAGSASAVAANNVD